MRDPCCGIEIGEVSLRKPEITIETVDQNFESVLQRVEVSSLQAVVILFRAPHLCLGFQPKSAQVGKHMPENLKTVGRGKAIELQHKRGIK